jgi:hypothetical protein
MRIPAWQLSSRHIFSGTGDHLVYNYAINVRGVNLLLP